MRVVRMLLFLGLICAASAAPAAVKYYDSSKKNGAAGDSRLTATNLCPPVQTTPADLQGFYQLLDDGLGTVTLQQFNDVSINLIDLGPDQLTLTFGPGSFVFIDNNHTQTISAPHVSTTSNIGGHGASGTGPSETTEWGLVSGFQITGARFCISSPVSICDQNGFAHGQTIVPTLNSDTYNLGTWSFDADGDFESDQYIIFRTSNGGLSNNQSLFRGAFVGASLPALPLIGFGALALSLAVIGGRSLVGKK